MSLQQWENHDFEGEINRWFAIKEMDGARGMSPLDFVTDVCIESFVGWSVGYTAQMMLIDLGLMTTAHKRRDELTEKGRAFVWWRYKRLRQPVDVSSTGSGE